VARTIVITGASSGIGRAAAGRFLTEGWNTVLIARRAAALIEVADGRPEALCLTCDVTDPAAVDHAFASAASRFGRIDALFNNAGVFPAPGLIDEIELDDWHAALDVNLNGMVYAARAAFRQMRQQSPQGGRIINNGSISAHAPRPGSLGYTVTKHAISGLTKVLALDGRPFGIACGQIDIGNARTELAAPIGQGAKQADGSTRPEPMMEVGDAADAVFAMATLPASANVLSMTIMATNMPYVGRG